MFIEVYVIPPTHWTEPVEDSIIKSNRRLIPINNIRVRHSNICENRAEIYLDPNTTIHVVGSYDEIVERISQVTEIKRVNYNRK
jgi:hypothetical protein